MCSFCCTCFISEVPGQVLQASKSENVSACLSCISCSWCDWDVAGNQHVVKWWKPVWEPGVGVFIMSCVSCIVHIRSMHSLEACCDTGTSEFIYKRKQPHIRLWVGAEGWCVDYQCFWYVCMLCWILLLHVCILYAGLPSTPPFAEFSRRSTQMLSHFNLPALAAWLLGLERPRRKCRLFKFSMLFSTLRWASVKRSCPAFSSCWLRR